MNESKAFCPQCKADVTFIESGGKSTCPVCGFAYELNPPVLQGKEPSGRETSPLLMGALGILGLLLRAFLILVAVVVVVLAIVFAGCVLGG